MKQQTTFQKVVTANDLLTGEVIYLAADGAWVLTLAHAEVLSDEARAQERLTFATAQAGKTVGVYLADVICDVDGAKPVHFREDFRNSGPSNYFHGKQEHANV